MKRIAVALTAALSLAACGGGDAGNGSAAAGKKEELRPLDPNPPMSASDIDSIVKETRDRDAARGGGATAQPAENASATTNN